MHLSLGGQSGTDEEPRPASEDLRHVGHLDVASLYREEAPRLRRYFSRRLASDRVADLVQTAFVRMLGLTPEKQAALDEPGAYLSRVAGNLVKDDAKFAQRHCEACHVSLEEGALAANDPVALLESRDMLARVDAAIVALPLRTREIFMAHRFEDMTYPQIAERVGVSIKTVEKHISLALRELRRALRPGG